MRKNDTKAGQVDGWDLDGVERETGSMKSWNEGWKVRVVQNSNGKGHRTFFVSPSGDHFSGAIAAIKFMVENKDSIENIKLIMKKMF